VLRGGGHAIEGRNVVQVAMVEAVVDFAAQHVFQISEVRPHAVLVETTKLPESTHRPGMAVQTVARRAPFQHVGGCQSALDGQGKHGGHNGSTATTRRVATVGSND